MKTIVEFEREHRVGLLAGLKTLHTVSFPDRQSAERFAVAINRKPDRRVTGVWEA